VRIAGKGVHGMTRWLMGFLLAAGCALENGAPTPPSPLQHVDAGTDGGVVVPVDAEGWPIGWPRTGVNMRTAYGDLFYIPGPDRDSEHAPVVEASEVDIDVAVEAMNNSWE
jgi:hypothetical protein